MTAGEAGTESEPAHDNESGLRCHSPAIASPWRARPRRGRSHPGSTMPTLDGFVAPAELLAMTRRPNPNATCSRTTGVACKSAPRSMLRMDPMAAFRELVPTRHPRRKPVPRRAIRRHWLPIGFCTDVVADPGARHIRVTPCKPCIFHGPDAQIAIRTSPLLRCNIYRRCGREENRPRRRGDRGGSFPHVGQDARGQGNRQESAP